MFPRAHFEFAVENQRYPKQTYKRAAWHTFTSQAKDWGFIQFMTLSEVNNPQKGFLIRDTLVLKVKITVQRDKRYMHTSKKQTGYVGLKNQGTTCCMNSLLQCLYHLPYFRKAVYHMPTLETDKPECSLPLALQSLFFKLQRSPTSVSTKALTKSFGWSTYETSMQRDVQEIGTMLFEKLEEKMRGTKVEEAIQYLFVGRYSSHITCIDVDFKSTMQQSFMTIQLEVKGCNDIYASLDKFCKEERLDGQNKYQAEGHGLVDARKHVKFDCFPPVLQLHLKRSDYDFQRDMQIKINDHYEFYPTLDLDVENRRYLTEHSDRSVRNLYKLHSVLAHSGGPHGGHYFAYIRPADRWYKFDDETVREETEKGAIQDQFGGDDETEQPELTTHSTACQMHAKQSTAYMLVYIRQSEWDAICCSCRKEEIAETVRARFEAERLEKIRMQSEKEKAPLYVMIKVACDRDFQKQIGSMQYFGLVNFDQVKGYRIHKRTTFKAFRQKVAEDFGVEPRPQCFWVWKRRANGTLRPHSRLPFDGKLDDVLDLREYTDSAYSPSLGKNAIMTIKLYLEMPETPTRPLFGIPLDSVLLFFKLYDPRKRQLSYATHMHVRKSESFASIFQTVGKLVDFPEGTEILACEEIRFNPSVPSRYLPADFTPEMSQLVCGDIICVQKRLSDVEFSELKHPTVRSFLEHIQNIKPGDFSHWSSPRHRAVVKSQ